MHMNNDFDRLVDRSQSLAIKYARRKAVFGREDVLPMWVADMDFATPGFIIEALQQRLEHPVLGYTFRPQSFYEAYKQWAQKRYSWNVELEWLTFSPGVVAALSLSVLSYTEPGDRIIIQPPVYPPFFETVKGLERELVLNPLRRQPDGRYVMDFDDLKRKIDSRTRLIIISNPHNPVGRAWTEQELRQLAQIALDNNLLIISDDIHADFVYKGYKYTPVASLSPEIARITVTATSPSKTFNIPGLSTSVVIIPDQGLRQKYNEKLNAAHLWLGNIFGNIAFEEAYTKGEQWLDSLLDYLEQNIDYVVQFISENVPSIKMWRPEATFLLWLDFSGTGLSHDEVKDKLINEARLGFNDGRTFGEQGENFFRMNIAAPRSVVTEALDRLRSVFG